MLSLSSPAQKTLGEEDSSGSDAGSEVGLEPETDRFGFIVTNGSTVGSAGPPPELVRQREAKWINIIGQWDRMLLKKTSKVKVQCQKGIPASLRAKCWPLLCGATDRMKQNSDLYTTLDSQPALQNWVDVIERDLDRQFPFHEMFLSKDGHGQRGLFRVLKAYTQYQPEEGYCQAQGPVAAVLLMNMPAEEAFWCLVQISEQYLPGYYSPLLEGVLFDAAMLTWVLKRTCPAAHKHLQHHGVEPLMFATDWLMCLFTRHLPFNTLLRVWDLFFCYGVRVLLQVAVVLVRRVLGRGDQRKQCQGQMETLERLRGVREEVQDEDDSFIAEVCAVPLSAKDLEKHTEKELEKWRKDRPSSIFDPRGRCQGYRMAWARARQREEERERGEREKGNLSVPLVRSASTLSLSPSILHKRWRKGGKVNTAGEWEGGGKVVRHLSMGAKEDWRSWTELNLKKVQGFEEEEDIISEEYKKQSEPKLKGQPKEKELKEMDKTQNVSTETVKEIVPVKDETEHTETIITEEEESQLTEIEDNKVLSEQTEETNVVTEPTNEQTAENVLLTSDHTQGGEPDPSPQQEQQRPQGEDPEFKLKDINEETEKQSEESEEKVASVEGNQTELQEEADAETNKEEETEESADASEERVIQADTKPGESAENEQQVDAVAEASETETGPGSETGGEVEAPPVKDPETETETQQQEEEEKEEEEEEEEEEVIRETENSSEGDVFKEKYHSTESLTKTDVKDEPQTQTETDVQVQTQEKTEENAAIQEESEAEVPLTDSEEHVDSTTEAETLILCLPECFQPKEGADITGDEETEAEIPVSNSVMASPVCSEERCDAAAASEPPQEEGETSLTGHLEAETRAQETPPETQPHEETPASATPQQEEVTSTQEVDLIAEPDGETGLAEMTPSPHQAGSAEMMSPTEEQSEVRGAVEVEESKENVQERAVGEDDVFISGEATDPNTDGSLRVQDKDPHPVTDQTEANNSSLTQASSRRSSRSSGDFRVRKSSSSRGSGSVRRLSEDLFTVPVKISQTQPIPNQPEVKQAESKSNQDVNQTRALPDVTRSTEVTSLPEEATERTAAQQEQPDPPKRFGLFRRLRGEHHKKAKAKMQVPKILIQDFSDDTGVEKPVEEDGEEKLSSRERRRRRRERERREKEEERLKKKREKELEKERERERRKPQTRGKSFQGQKEKASSDEPQAAKTRTIRYSATYDESYF